MIGHPMDVCECGDYRRQHAGGTGRCLLGRLCTPTPCQQFKLYRLHVPETEDEAAELMDNGRNTGGKVYR